MPKENRVVRVSLSGGLIGFLTTNPTRALNTEIARRNKEGWTPHSERNLLVLLLQIAVLILTVGLWTWGAGYLVLFDREPA